VILESHSLGAFVFSISRNLSNTRPSSFGTVTVDFGKSVLYVLLIVSSLLFVSSNLSNNCNDIKHSASARLFENAICYIARRFSAHFAALSYAERA
jgi:hypothetical protein